MASARTYPALARRTSSDYPLLLQLFEVVVLEPHPGAVNIAVVMSQKRRTSYIRRRIVELDRAAGHRELTPHRVIDRDDHAALAQVRVVEQFDAVEHGAAWHTRLAHDLHDLMLGARAGPFLEDFALTPRHSRAASCDP